MTLKEVIYQLEQKWGPFVDAENSTCNGTPEYMESGLKYNPKDSYRNMAKPN